MHYTYIIESENDGTLYIGYSDNPWRRIQEHNGSFHHTFTPKHRPWKLKTIFQAGEYKTEVLRIERFIKR